MILKKKLEVINYSEVTLIFIFLYLGLTFFSVAISNICFGVSCATFLSGLLLKQIGFKDFNINLYLAIASPFLLTVISVLNSASYSTGFGYLNIRLPILIAPFMLLCIKLERSNLKKAFLILLVSAIIASIATFYNAVKYFHEDFLFKTGFTYFITIIHHPYFGVYLLLATLGLFEFNLIADKRLKFVVILILSIAISFTTSRIVYALYFLLISLYLFKKLSKKRFKLSIMIIGLLASLFIFSNRGILNKFTILLDHDKSPRLKLWKNSLEVLEKTESYIFGIGIGDFYKEKKDVYFGHNYGNKTIGAYGYNPHSQPIEFYITNGLFGLGVLVFALSLYLFKLKRQNTFAFSAFMIIFSFSLVECILNRQYGVQLYCTIIPLIINQNFKKT